MSEFKRRRCSRCLVSQGSTLVFVAHSPYLAFGFQRLGMFRCLRSSKVQVSAGLVCTEPSGWVLEHWASNNGLVGDAPAGGECPPSGSVWAPSVCGSCGSRGSGPNAGAQSAGLGRAWDSAFAVSSRVGPELLAFRPPCGQ